MSRIQKTGEWEAVEEPIADGSPSVSVRDADFGAGRALVQIWNRKWKKDY